VTDRDSAGRTITRGARATAFGFVIRFGARLLFLVVAARLFGATVFGAFVLASAIVELAVSVGSLSTKKTIFPLLDEAQSDPDRPLTHILLDAAVLIAAASTALAALVMAIVILLSPATLPPATAAALFILAPTIAGQSLLDLLLAGARWKQKIRYEVVSRSIVEPYALALASLGAFASGMTERGLLLGYWCGTLAALAYAAYGVRKCLGRFRLGAYRPSPAVFRAIGRSAAANSANDLVNALYTRIDIYLVAAFLGERPEGIYGVARQATTPIRQVRQSFDALLIPAVARSLASQGAARTAGALASATRLILAVQLPILIVLFAVGAPLLDALGRGFSVGYWALVILAAAELLQAAFGIGDLVFVYARPRLGLQITVAGTVVGTLSALLLIPAWGIDGAAASVLVGYVFRAGLRIVVLRRRFDIPVAPLRHAGLIACAIAGVASAQAVHGGSAGTSVAADAAALIVGLALYGAGMVALLRAGAPSLALGGFEES
jgi:O-antigen/teichoic acid export membrane protein